MDNQHKLIKGYRDLSQAEIDAMNSIKALEVDTGNLFKQISDLEGVDKRSLSLAKTQLQQGFMWFVRAIAQPHDPYEYTEEEEDVGLVFGFNSNKENK